MLAATYQMLMYLIVQSILPLKTYSAQQTIELFQSSCFLQHYSMASFQSQPGLPNKALHFISCFCQLTISKLILAAVEQGSGATKNQIDKRDLIAAIEACNFGNLFKLTRIKPTSPYILTPPLYRAPVPYFVSVRYMDMHRFTSPFKQRLHFRPSAWRAIVDPLSRYSFQVVRHLSQFLMEHYISTLMYHANQHAASHKREIVTAEDLHVCFRNRNALQNFEKKRMLILWARTFDEKSVFHKDYMPLDLIKFILNLADLY